MPILEQLQAIGLNEKAARIYLAALELGLASIQNIAQKAQIKRSTVYEIINDLISQNLITVAPKGKRRYFLAAEPAKLTEIMEKRQAALKTILPELEALSTVSPIKPKIRYYEGIDGIKTVYNDTLSADKEILAFVSISDISKQKELKEFLDESYVRQRAAKKIFARVIAPDSVASKEYKKNDTAGFRQTKLIAEKEYPFSVEINIYGNKIAIMSFKAEESMGIIIESREISQTLRLIHKFFWNKIK